MNDLMRYPQPTDKNRTDLTRAIRDAEWRFQHDAAFHARAYALGDVLQQLNGERPTATDVINVLAALDFIDEQTKKAGGKTYQEIEDYRRGARDAIALAVSQLGTLPAAAFVDPSLVLSTLLALADQYQPQKEDPTR